MKQLHVAEKWLADMSRNTRYEILEEGSESGELEEIAAKFGVQLPCNDLAVFKGTYAYVDRTNLNGCSLPQEEVIKALGTLRGKAIDFDHLRKRVVGYHLDATLEDKEIVCYGIFFKGNFPEDYDIIKQCMKEGKLGISFEAWGTRERREDGDYDLVDIEFAGGALLISSDPAFPGAGVLELSKHNKVLEFAKVMTEPKSHILETSMYVLNANNIKVKDKNSHYPMETLQQAKHSLTIVNSLTEVPSWYEGTLEELKSKVTEAIVEKHSKILDKANYCVYEFEMILRALAEVPWHKGEEECWREVSLIDFTKNIVVITYQPSGTEVSVNLTPSSVVTKQGKPVKDLKGETVSVSFIEKFQKFEGNFDELEAFVQKEMDYESIQLPEMAYLSIKERTKLNDSDFAVIKKLKNITSGKRRKVRMFPLNDATHVRIALARLEKDNVKDTFTELGISFKTVQQRILNKAKELKMKDIMEKYEQATTDEQVELYATIVKEVATLKTQIQELTQAQEAAKVEATAAITAKDTELASIKVQLEEITKAKDLVQAELDRRDEEIKKAKVASRKEALGEFAKDIADADILDEVKYEMALLKKENAELKKAVAETSTTEDAEKPKEKVDETAGTEMTKGSKDKSKDEELKKINERVLKQAYGA
jgi:hypothetical protein